MASNDLHRNGNITVSIFFLIFFWGGMYFLFQGLNLAGYMSAFHSWNTFFLDLGFYVVPVSCCVVAVLLCQMSECLIFWNSQCPFILFITVPKMTCVCSSWQLCTILGYYWKPMFWMGLNLGCFKSTVKILGKFRGLGTSDILKSFRTG